MLVKFWEGVGGKLADRWSSIAGPALAFWLGGLIAWGLHSGGLNELEMLARALGSTGAVAQIALVVAILLGVATSGLVVERLTLPVLRLLEGYWPRRAAGLRRAMVRRIVDGNEAADRAWQKLTARANADADAIPADELAELARLDELTRRRPQSPNLLQPTRIGNILRSSETWPNRKYGLDAIVTWPRLWLLLPETTQKEISAARVSLDNAVAAAVWGALFLAFTPWSLLAVPVAVLVVACAVRWWIPARATVFGDLVEAAYDVHRGLLYDHLRWPRPKTPRCEPEQGRQLTIYLWRGSDAPAPRFVSPKDGDSS